MTSLNRGPAKIYAFPARGRVATSSQHEEPVRGRPLTSHVPCVSSSSSWYHDEAIREAEQQRKN